MRHAMLILFVISVAGHVVRAADVASPGLARALVRLLQSAPLTAFAAADPERHGSFVAALYVPVQLLVIEAVHPDVAAINARIAAGQYRDVYLDLQGSPAAEGRFFVMDANADGLLALPANHGGVDVVYDGTTAPLFLNGEHGLHRREPVAYDAALVAADAKYSQALEVLQAALEMRAGSR